MINTTFSFLSTYWLLGLPIMLLLPGMSGFVFPSVEAQYSDMAVSHYPNALYLIESIKTWGAIPLWSSSIFSGYPFFANPLSGLWYFPGWFALIFPLPLGFNITVAFHLMWGGAGMYLFLRSQRLEHRAALFGALVFELMPKIFAHYGAGHLTLMYAIPWTPWLLWAGFQARIKQTNKTYVLVSLIIAIIFVADVRWCVYALMLWATWEFVHGKLGHWRRIKQILSQVVVPALLAAPLAIPLLEYTNLSARSLMSAEDVLIFSLPPERLFGLLFPDLGGAHEWMIYVGGVVFGFAVLGIIWPASRNRSSYWVWVMGLAILFSLGSYLPGMEIIAELPGVSLLRVPSRALFIFGIAAAILAAQAFNHMLTGVREKEAVRARLTLAGLVGFSVVIAVASSLVSGGLLVNMVWGAGVALSIFVLLLVFLAGRIEIKIWVTMIFIITIFDLMAMNASLFVMKSSSEVLSEGSEAAAYISRQPGKFRVYSPSYSIPQQTAAFYGLELVDGVDPLYLERYASFMETASGVPRQGYAVTIPSFAAAEDDISQANSGFTPNSELKQLNVGFIVAAFDLDIKYTQLMRFGTTRVYEISNELGYVYVQDKSVKSAELVLWSPNRIEINAEGPGVLVVSEIPYPGWVVLVDGERAEIFEIEGVNRAVELTEGNHTVEFVFRPQSLYIGWVISLVTMIGLTIYSRKVSQWNKIE